MRAVMPRLLERSQAKMIERDHLGNNPHHRLTTPEDVAEAVVLLSRTDSSWITGNTIGVDGAELLAAAGSWARDES